MTPTELRRWVFSRLGDQHKTQLKTISALMWSFLSTMTLGVAALARRMAGSTAARHPLERAMPAAQGLEAIRRGFHLGLSSAPNGRRELSVVRIGWELLKRASGGPSALLRATAAWKKRG